MPLDTKIIPSEGGIIWLGGGVNHLRSRPARAPVHTGRSFLAARVLALLVFRKEIYTTALIIIVLRHSLFEEVSGGSAGRRCRLLGNA